MATHLPHLADVDRISSRVVRILGGNPSKFTLQGTNTYLVGQGPKRILIDTGDTPTAPIWLKSLKQALADEKAEIQQVILTHWHPDHVGGVKDVRTLFPDVKVYKNQPGADQLNIDDGQRFQVEGATLRSFHSPGHTTDHMALTLEEEDAMFTGDNVLGHGTAVFEDLPAYIKSLQGMQQAFSGRAYPGHGDVIEDGKAKITEYIAHRQQREDQILDVLKQSRETGKPAAKGWASMEMVKVIYKDYPENLHAPAEGGVLQVLKKLEGEGRVRKVDGSRWDLGSKAAL